MDGQQKPALKFPAHFLWGASSSAHQVEGGNHNQWSVWELENAKALASMAKGQAKYLPKWDLIEKAATSPHNYVSGEATDHYNRYKEDFLLLKKMHMNSWRFSIEWSRIEPEEGAWSAEAIEHYRTYLQTLQKVGIEPVVTLWHWTVPVWFEQKGGWTKRSNVKYFLRFVEKVLEELGRDFRYVITLNEPEVYVGKSFITAEWPPQNRSKLKAVIVMNNLIKAHKSAYKLIKKTGRKYMVAIAHNIAYHYAGDDALLSRLTAGTMKWIEDYYLLNKVRKTSDFIGVNYYFSNRYYGTRMHNLNKKVSDMGWDMQPANIQFVLEDLADRYDKPIIVTENGLADAEDEHRQWWLMQTIMAMHRAMQNGVKLQGYLHWSLTDNFEWSSGFWPRFGLAEVDYATKKRTLRRSAVWFGGVIKKLRSV
jgi:beta-glucosidase